MMAPMSQPPTEGTRAPALTDVARLAGVSHQTVSRVVNGLPNVRPQTRDRVLAAMAEIGYRPNRAAKALATGRSQTLGLIAQASTLYGPASALAAFGEAAAQAGYAVVVATVRYPLEASIRDAVELLLDQRVAGVAVLAPFDSAQRAAAGIPVGVPLVMLDGPATREGCAVTVDQAEGAGLATAHLLKAGHRGVWHVTGPSDWFDAQERVTGWRRTLEDSDVAVPPVIVGDWSARSGFEAGLILARRPEITAVFAANDHMALGLIRALVEQGRRVPQDVSVVGFDDVPEAGYFLPPLTTIRQDFEALASAGVQSLLAQIHGGPPVRVQRIAPVLIARASVAPPGS